MLIRRNYNFLRPCWVADHNLHNSISNLWIQYYISIQYYSIKKRNELVRKWCNSINRTSEVAVELLGQKRSKISLPSHFILHMFPHTWQSIHFHKNLNSRLKPNNRISRVLNINKWMKAYYSTACMIMIWPKHYQILHKKDVGGNEKNEKIKGPRYKNKACNGVVSVLSRYARWLASLKFDFNVIHSCLSLAFHS